MANYKCNKPYSIGWNGVSSKYEYRPDPNLPLPPNNMFVTSPYITGVLDIRWDNPLERAENSQYSLKGVNLYRSLDNECGPYEKVNESPIQTLYYRDVTNNQLRVNENATPTLQKGTNARKEWVICTSRRPVVKAEGQGVLASSPEDVSLKIDRLGDGNYQTVPIKKINPSTGEIFLITQPTFNPRTKKFDPPVLPDQPNSQVLISYRYNSNLIRNDLYPRYFYKVTTVGLNKEGKELETKLGDVMPVHVHQLEKPHYIWKGIIARNRFLLEQLGERVKIFIRKEVGDVCPSYSYNHGQSHHDCTICFGTGIIGGYEGPVDATIALPEAEKRIDLTDVGLKMNFTFESWMGPSPLVRTRDFIVRQNNERMTIGSVTPQGPKGAVFQQHFQLNYRDSNDIIYRVPIDGGQVVVPVADDTRNVNNPVTDASPVIPDYKSERAKTEKGRSIDFENVTW